MTTALRVKFDVQDLDRAAATAVICEAVSGEDWQDGYTFADGSSMTVSFFDDDSDSVEQCVIHWYDARGERPDPAVRTRFTCSFMDNKDFIEAYYDGSIFFGRALPYLTFNDMTNLMRQVSGVQIVSIQARHRRYLMGSERVFEILPPGYEWGEHKTASPFLLDLGYRVIEVYAISGPDWEWMPFYSSAEDTVSF